ncbi:tetratricopeptide repeat protein [Sorangium sp. So ce1000]|uniref:tetratricopeptide repeat protein n=1 Tax=Sorangium sp. So ce1000 TaxID=3133325 RepID=UPI003F63D872
MSVETIRMALGRLQDEPENEAAWNELQEAVTAPNNGAGPGDVERLLGAARARHEQRKEWQAVARLLELEIALAAGSAVEPAMQAELARVYHEELIDVDRAAAAYKRLLELRPDDDAAAEAIETDASKRERWRDLVDRYVAEAEGATDGAFKSALYTSAADIGYRYGRAELGAKVAELIELALQLDPKNRRAANLAEIAFATAGDWDAVVRVQALVKAEAQLKEDRIAAALRAARTIKARLSDPARAVAAYEELLDLSPGQPEALSFLTEAYSAAGDWDRLVALYEDQLRSGGVKPGEELGMLVQIAMVHWRMRGQPQAAEPYFDRVRRADPAHAGMLNFYREVLEQRGDKPRLTTILTDAQRAVPDGPEKRAIATELARLAESQENAAKAIEQYKSVLRTDPENRQARDALKRLYLQTEGYNALVELHRQDLERTPADDVAGRVAVLREIAAIYRDRAKNDAALVTVLTQIVQLDDKDVDAVRELTRIYESLGRWRDLLSYQQRLAELTESPAEKAGLYRAVARRWFDQFSNVQNAIAAYEALLTVEPIDEEAQQKLRELYLKRRAWPQLYSLYERKLEGAEGAAKIELLGEMAKLAAERLDRGADAIALQKRILELDPSAPGVLDALEKQAEREKDFATVAEVLERRVDLAADDAARLVSLQKLGAVYAERLKDPAQAARTWRRVLTLSPGHARALRVLRDAYFVAGDWDGLEELYASQNDWEGLVDFLSGAADKATDPATKLDISFRAARIFEEQLKAPERAARSYERVLSVSPKDARAAAALVPIYEEEEKWARLPALYEILLDATDDAEAQVGMLRKLAAVTGGPLSDKPSALGYARRAYELKPDDEGLDLLEAWSRAAGSWGPFVEAVEGRLRTAEDLATDVQRTLRLKLAEVYAREMGKLDEAVTVYRGLVEDDPSDEGTVRALDALLRANERQADLRWLFELRASQVGGEDRAEILEEWATLEEEVFGDPAKAIELLRKVIALTPGRINALRVLSRLLNAAGEYEAAAQIVATHRDVSEGDERARREIELATLYLDRLDRPADAFEAAVRALDLAAHDPDAITVLSRLVERPETRVRAAKVLAIEYAETGNHRREAMALRVILEAERDPARRRELYLTLASVEESKLHAAGTAFDALLRALHEFSDDIELWDRAAELSRRAGRPTDLAEAYRVHLVAGRTEGDKVLGSAVEVELCERAASLHDEQLGDPEGAKPYLERVLSLDPNNRRAFERLKQILTAAERWGELEELYDRAAKGTTDQSERIELLNEVALIAEEIIGDAAKAIGYYERILELDPFYTAALDSLEKLYEREGRFRDLAALLEQRLKTATEAESVEIKLSLGSIYLDRLHEPDGSLGHLEDVLRIRQNDPKARELVERLLDIGALRLRAARVLEAVYEARDEIRQLVRVLEIRRQGAETESERRELLRRVSVLQDERLKDDAGAFASLSELLPLEPEDLAARERLIEIGRRLGEHEQVAEVLTAAADACGTASIRGEILMEVARICEDLLGDADRAEKVYRRVLAIDPTDPSLVIPAAQALGRIYAAKEQHQALAGVLAIEVRLEDNVETRRSLHERIGTLYETMLDDPAKAIEAWQARLGDDGTDAAALAALERLYERTAQWRELVSVLRAREQSTTEPEERRRAMTKAAETLAQKLADVPEAINAWRAVLDEFGPERPTLAALEELYELDERWVDLAETLEVDLSLAVETADRLDLLARLGDVRRLHQADATGALEAYRQALSLDPSNARCRAALEAMLEREDARRDAAETLEPLYEADGDAERLLRVLEIKVETSDLPSERLATLQKALRTAEGPLGDTSRAFGYALRGVREAAGEPDVTTWIATVERLGEATGRWSEVCELFQRIAPDILDGDVQQNVRLRVGELARHKLDDRELAVEQYKKALEARGDDRRAMIALEELYGEARDAGRLLEILKLRVEHAETDDEKTALLFRIAELERGPLGDQAAAIATYETILDIALHPDAIAALDGLYREAGRFQDLIRLYERQLDVRAGDLAELHVKIALVAHRHTEDLQRAFDELSEALLIDPAHEGAVSLLETILEGSAEAEHRARAGEMLEPVYLRRADWNRVKIALDARLAASQDPVERRDLLQRLATLHEEQLEDYRAALETVAKLLHEDLADEGVWAELERLAKVASAERRLAEIYAAELGELTSDDASSAKLSRRTGELYAQLGDVTDALKWYRRAHEFEPDSRELFDAIDGLLVKEGRHAERIQLYRAALDYRKDEDRLDALHTIARLERTELREPALAIETYRAALDVDENDARALDALTELYRELDRPRDLADLYLRRAEAAPNGERAAPYRLALAELLRRRLDDTTGAIDQLEAIVGEVPSHAEAIRALEALIQDPQHKARVVEILGPLYEGADDWRQLVRLNDERFGLASDAREKVAVLRETAKLWETRGNDELRAFDATRTAFGLDPDDGDTRGELERLAEQLGAWEELAESLEQGVTTTSDELTKRELLSSLAKVYDTRIDDPRRALRAYARLSALDPSDPEPLEQMDTLAVLLSDWDTLIAVLEKKSEMASDEENASICRRIAETKLEMLEDTEGAIQAYERALELDPESAMTIDALIELHEPRGAASRLVELYGRRVELAGPDEESLRYDLNVRAAERYERDLSSPRDAIAALNAALDAKPGDPAVLSSLERLYRAERMWDELLSNLMLQASAAADRDARIKLRTAIGDLYAGELESPSDAIEQYRLVLDEDAVNDHAIQAVRAIGEGREELRLDAAEVLEPVLRSAGRHEELAAALELRLRAQTEPADRAATLRAIALVQDVQLGRPLEAEQALLRALEDAPDDASLHGEIERLAERTGGFGRYCDALAQRASATFDATIAKDLFLRIGRIAEEKLGDDRRSAQAYAKAVEHAGDTPELLEALDRLYGRLGDERALADVLERRVAVTPGDRDQADLFYRLAVIQIGSFGDKPQGLNTLRQALDRAVDHERASASLEALTEDPALFDEAAEALEGVYRTRGDNAALARLYEKRIRFAPGGVERIRMRLDLAKVLEVRSNDPRAALETLEKALADDPSDPDVLGEIERLAPLTGGWASAASALERAVRAGTDLDGDTARDLWMRIAEWQKNKVGDAKAAEAAYEAALTHDPTSEHILRSIEELQRAPGRERDLIGTLRRIAALDGMEGNAGELRREAKELAERALGDRELVEAILREMIAADEGDTWALAELTKVREEAGDHKEVFRLLVRQSELYAEADRIRDARHAAAAVAREKLGDDAAAIELYETLFEADPGDARAATALRELYAKAGKHKELLALLERLTDLAESPEARSALRLESAEICLSRLDAVSEATEHLRAVLDEQPDNEKATVLLAQLLEKTGRDQELSDLFVTQIERAKDRGDVAAELSYSVRLGEVYEARLNDTARAIETYRAVLEREPRHHGALLALARLHEQRGEKAEAAQRLEVILEDARAAEAVGTALRLADLHRSLGDEGAVRRVLERGLAADGSAQEIRKQLLALYEKQQAFTELADLITGDAEAAAQPAEKVALYRKAAGIHLAKRNDPGRAADLLVKATELVPGDRELLLALCDAYSASGRGQKAAEALQQIVESYGGRRSKDLAAIHHRLAKAYLAEGQRERALAELDIAFKIDPGSIAILRDLGVLALDLSESGDDAAKAAHIDRAQKTFRALLLQKLDEGAPISKGEVFYYLGVISHRQNDDKKAIQMLERALDNERDFAPAKELLAQLKK